MRSVFFNPWMLLALAAGAIPLIIELLFRRRRKVIDLPSVRYLLTGAAQKKVKRQDRLLLIVRCAIPLLLALALARPQLAPSEGRAGRNREVMILLDRTVSMGQQTGPSTAFALARSRAGRLIGMLPPGTTVSIVSLGQRPVVHVDRSKDLYAAGELVAGLKLTHGAAAVAEAMPILDEWLAADAPADTARELYVFSDFQKTTWLRKTSADDDPAERLRAAAARADVFLVDVGGRRPLNYYLTSLTPAEPLLVAGVKTRFTAVVESRGPAAENPLVTLTFLVDGRKQGLQQAPLQSRRAAVSFEYRFAEPGEYLVEVAVEGDSHPIDNRRYYLASVPASRAVLILDEAADASEGAGESAYLTAAISPLQRPGLDRSSIFSTKVIHPADVIAENLSDYVAVVLLGAERIPTDLSAKLEPYVREGGSALLFLGRRTNVWEYNQGLHRDGGGLLPAALGDGASTAAAPLGVEPAAAHPAFAMIAPDAFAAPLVARRVTLAAGVAARPGSVVATFTDGKPAILERTFGAGRVVAFLTAAGPPENFMPTRAAYPIMLQEMLRYLAGDPDRGVNLENGQTFRQSVRLSARHLIVRKPDGGKVRLRPVKTDGGRGLEVSFTQTDRCGLYTVDARAGVMKRPRFVVNLQSAEGDLDRLEADDAEQMFGSSVRWVGPARPIESVVKDRYAARELAGAILWILAAMMATEMLLAMRFGSRRQT